MIPIEIPIESGSQSGTQSSHVDTIRIHDNPVNPSHTFRILKTLLDHTEHPNHPEHPELQNPLRTHTQNSQPEQTDHKGCKKPFLMTALQTQHKEVRGKITLFSGSISFNACLFIQAN